MQTTFVGLKKRAFTLVELLTVVAIIGILVSMVFPAVQAVRNAARRNSCLNNLRQIQLSVLNYEAQNQHLPTAGAHWHWSDITPSENPQSYNNPVAGSMLTAILPFVGQLAPYERLREELDTSGSNPETLAQRLAEISDFDIPTFSCPSTIDIYRLSNSSVETGGTAYKGEFTSHYFGITGPIGQGQSTDTPPIIYPSSSTNYRELKFDSAGNVDNQDGTALPIGGEIGLEGIFAPSLNGQYSNRLAIDTEDVLDGTSNTLAFSEIARNAASNNGDDPQLVGWAFGALYGGTTADPILQNVYSAKTFKFKINRTSTSTNPTPVYDKINTSPLASNHGGGAQFALADGSVRFINESVDEDVLKTWMTINAREKTSPDDLKGN